MVLKINLKVDKKNINRQHTSLFVSACSPANSSMLRPPIFVGSDNKKRNNNHT